MPEDEIATTRSRPKSSLPRSHNDRRPPIRPDAFLDPDLEKSPYGDSYSEHEASEIIEPEKESLGPILSEISSFLPPKVNRFMNDLATFYHKWIRRIILLRMLFSAATNPSRISGVISGVVTLCMAQMWLAGQDWHRRVADTGLGVLVVMAVYIKSDPVSFQALLGDYSRDRDTDSRQLRSNSTTTPYRSPVAFCLEPYTSPLAFCYDPVVFIPAVFMIYKRLAMHNICPGMEGRVIDGMSILTAIIMIWILFPEFSWQYALNGRPWTIHDGLP